MTEQEANAMTDSLAIISETRLRDPFQNAVPCFQQHPLAQQRENQWLQYLVDHPEFDRALTVAENHNQNDITFHKGILNRVLQAQRDLGWSK